MIVGLIQRSYDVRPELVNVVPDISTHYIYNIYTVNSISIISTSAYIYNSIYLAATWSWWAESGRRGNSRSSTPGQEGSRQQPTTTITS